MKIAWIVLFSLFAVAGCGGGDAVTSTGGGVEVAILGGAGDVPGRFSRPRGVACEPDGTLYVVDMAGRLQKLTADGEPIARVDMPAIVDGKPNGLTYLPAREPGEVPLVAASDTHYHRITMFRSSDLSLVGFRAKGEFFFATHLAPLGDRWFVTEYGDVSRIVALAAPLHTTPGGVTPGAVLARFGGEGDGPGELSRPMGIAVGPDGDLYVSDACNGRVDVFGPDGTFRRSLGHPGEGPGELRYPYGIAIDPAGHVVVAEYGNQRVQVLDPRDGRSLRVFGRPGAGPGEFGSPWGLCIDARGRVFVADRDNHRIQRLTGLLDGLPAVAMAPAGGAR